MQDRIVQSIELAAPVSRIWRALTDHREFGEWFRVDLERPVVVGEWSSGRITYPGYEHLIWKAKVTVMEPEHLFAFTWCPYNVGPEVDSTKEPQTLVEFRLTPTEEGAHLEITESGFAALPDDPRRIEALRLNSQGWSEQVQNITAHVES